MNRTLKVIFLDLESMCMSVCLHAFMCITYIHGALGDQKRLSGFLELELPCECWGSNLDLLKKQRVFLITEPSLQPPVC